jgi:NAD(P)-dependent dehydrogenase (short-subunit alcohol dehydrogenase family)
MQGKVALVTGAASGIGAAVARQLAARGAKLVLLDINAAAGEELASSLGATFMRCDVADPAAWTETVRTCIAGAGVPDYVHLNAGVMSVGAGEGFMRLEDVPLANYQRIVSVNLGGVVFGMQALLPHMCTRHGAAITVTASMVGLVPLAVDPLYSATKHALVGLVRSVAAGMENLPLRVNAICPGGVDTAIVPVALRAAGMDLMPVELLATDVLDLLEHGANGEVRVRLGIDKPAFAVAAPRLDAGIS